jgi:hypothetical protein
MINSFILGVLIKMSLNGMLRADQSTELLKDILMVLFVVLFLKIKSTYSLEVGTKQSELGTLQQVRNIKSLMAMKKKLMQ